MAKDETRDPLDLASLKRYVEHVDGRCAVIEHAIKQLVSTLGGSGHLNAPAYLAHLQVAAAAQLRDPEGGQQLKAFCDALQRVLDRRPPEQPPRFRPDRESDE